MASIEGEIHSESPKASLPSVHAIHVDSHTASLESDRAAMEKPKEKEAEKRCFTSHRPGVAPIKAQYLKKVPKARSIAVPASKEDAGSASKEDMPKNSVPITSEECYKLPDSDQLKQISEEPPLKKQKVRGMNKNRPRHLSRTDPSKKLCPAVSRETECSYGDQCKFIHDVVKYMALKPPNIGDTCVNYEKRGKCPYGVTCRYGKSHITEDFKNCVNVKVSDASETPATRNSLSKDLQNNLRKKKYNFAKADEYLAHLNEVIKNSMPFSDLGKLSRKGQIKTVGAVTDEDTIRLLPDEKPKIDFSDKLYLAPLTTVGNLPYRRICKSYGADVTCSEMAMCTNLLQGHQSEWALLKRHSSEDLFGVQLCGSFPDSMTKCAELLQHEVQMDFVDINIGCPIDLVFKKGGGCALMGRMSKFEQIVRGMNYVLDVPLTVKMRAGIYDKKNTWNAHKIIPNIRDWGASLVTLHGRSREQRYTRSADWEYISECARAASPMPFFGNGDILSYEDANLRRELTGVTGVMVARGALIKPWIFTEIKEQRHWDISSGERLDMLKEFVNCGLEHWGSDTQGVENVRRFLLEWLSFLNRYIPVGLLERLPQRINERPAPYYGRDDLETLMASSLADDWVKISEMLLGPVPPDFSFVPKHRANSYTQGEG